MPKNVFGNNSSSNVDGSKNNPTLFEQKAYLATFYIDSNIEEDECMRYHFTIKNPKKPMSIGEAASKK